MTLQFTCQKDFEKLEKIDQGLKEGPLSLVPIIESNSFSERHGNVTGKNLNPMSGKIIEEKKKIPHLFTTRNPNLG